MKITFFHSKYEVDSYMEAVNKNRGPSPKEIRIAMTPTAYIYLKDRGLEAHNTLRYFTNESHLKLLEKGKALIDWLRENSDFVNLDIGVNESFRDSFILFMRCVINYLLWAIEIVLNAVEEHKPEVISSSYSDRKRVFSLYIEPEERYLGLVVKSVAEVKKIGYEDISRGKTDIFPEKGGYLLYAAKFFLKWIKIILWMKTLLLKTMLKRKRCVFLTTARNMGEIVNRLKENASDRPFYVLENPAVMFSGLPDFALRLLAGSKADKLMEQKRIFTLSAEKILKEKEIFSYRGISFAEEISKKISSNISHYIIGQFLWMAKLEDLFKCVKPLSVLSTGGRLDDILIAELCGSMHIPSILISHGSLTRPKNKFEFIEWKEQGSVLLRAPFSHIALQSPLAEEYLEAFSCSKKTIKTGPLVWGMPVDHKRSGELFKKIFNNAYDRSTTKVILHAGTQKASTGLRAHVYETPDEYIQSICEVAQAINKIQGVVLIIRFRPRKEIEVNDLKRLVPFSDKIALSTKESFIDVLGMADLLVSFSSTTIEEALQNRIPVLLYGGGGRYKHIPAYEVTTREPIRLNALYHIKGPEDLVNGIKGILELNMDSKAEERLFDRYIYPDNVRVNLTSWLESLK